MNKILDSKEVQSKNEEKDNDYENIEKNCHRSNKKEEKQKINQNEKNKEKEIRGSNAAQNEFQIKERDKNKKESHSKEKERVEYTKKIGNYILFDQIGMGTFSKVTKAIHLITSQQVAVKILDKEKIEDEIDLERIIREIEILKNIHHPNIAQMYETYSTIHNFYLMMELVSGGDLFDYISDNSCLSENESCHFFRQLIGVLEYLISMGITHRDIKPENILLDESHTNIKVIDFGLSNYCEDDELLSSSCGSPCYASPEMLSGNPYRGVKTDIWSAGIVLYSMLVGSLPFDDQELYILYEQIKKGKFFLPSTLSLEAIDLLKRILQVDPKKRIGIKEIKKHPWFNMENNPLYKGINIAKESFPCNKDVVKFILENFFKDDTEVNFDKIVNMIETHACNKYTSTYYLSKINILGIDDECITSMNNNINIANNNDKINIVYNNEKESSHNIFHEREKQLHKCRTKDSLDSDFNKNKIITNILGILNDETENNKINNINEKELNKKNKEIENNNNKKEEKQKKNNNNVKQNEENKTERTKSHKKENSKNQMNKVETTNNIKTQNTQNDKKKVINTINNSINKKEKISNKRNIDNKNVLYISNTERFKPSITTNDLKKENNLFSTQNKHKLNYNSVFDKENFNIFNFNSLNNKKLGKYIIKSNNNSCNKTSINDRHNVNINSNQNNIYITNNKKVNTKNNTLNNIMKNNNSEGYDKKQITYIKKNNTTTKINEIKRHLIHLKTPPKETGNFNFYVINNIINKEKELEHKKAGTLNFDNKTITRGITEPNEIKTFVHKKISDVNKIKNKENSYFNKLINNKILESKNRRNYKTKTDEIFVPFSLKTQLKLGSQKIKDELSKLNKIKVNLKSNNSDLYYQKSPAKTIIREINTYKKDLKKVIPKLKLEGINNKISNYYKKAINKMTTNENNNNSIPYNKIIIKNNYSCYTQNNFSNNNDFIFGNQNSINNRSDSIKNIDKNSKIYKRKTKKKNCLINKNNPTKTLNSLNEDIKKLSHQRNLSSALKSKLSKNGNNSSIINSNTFSSIIKESISSNKRNKVLKNNNTNNSYMNYFYAQNLKKRKSTTKSEDNNNDSNNINSYIHKSINGNCNSTNNRKIVKRTSYLGLNTKYNINNNDIARINNNNSHIMNNSINTKLNKPIKQQYYISNNNQNVININMVLKQNKYKNRNFNNNNYLLSSDSMTDTPITLNTEQDFIQSPYFTENISDFNNSDEKNRFKNSNYSTLLKKNEKRKKIYNNNNDGNEYKCDKEKNFKKKI